MAASLDVQANTSVYLNELKRFNSELQTYHKTLFITSSVLLAVGTAENIIVCLVFSNLASRVRTASQTTTKLSNFFILQLAITDLVYRAVSTFRRTTARFMELSPTHCKTAIFSQFTCATVTFVLLSGIAIDRYIHILFPIRSLVIKTRKFLILLSIWIYAVAICSGFIYSATLSGNVFNFRRHGRIPLFNSRRNNTSGLDYKEPRKHCIPGSSGSLERKVAFTVYFVFAFVVPLFCIIFSYTRITVFLWRKANANNSINRNIARAKLRAIQMFALVVLSFLISWGPVMILDIIRSYPVRKRSIRLGKFPLRPLFDCFSQTSSIFNPLIYAFGDTNFRRSLRLLFCRRRRGRVDITRVSPVKLKGAYIQMKNLTPRV